MEKTEKEKNLTGDFIKILFMMYVLTLLLLLLLAFLLFRMEISETVFQVWLIAVYIISGFSGGFLIGKRAKSRKFLWGFLIGTVYFAILFGVSLVLHKGLSDDVMHLVTTAVLCLASGTVGGMLS